MEAQRLPTDKPAWLLSNFTHGDPGGGITEIPHVEGKKLHVFDCYKNPVRVACRKPRAMHALFDTYADARAASERVALAYRDASKAVDDASESGSENHYVAMNTKRYEAMKQALFNG